MNKVEVYKKISANMKEVNRLIEETEELTKENNIEYAFQEFEYIMDGYYFPLDVDLYEPGLEELAETGEYYDESDLEEDLSEEETE